MKRHVTITLEDYIHDRLRERGVNISMICEDALRKVLETFDRNIDPEKCEHNWTWPFCTPQGLVKECKRCGELKRVIIESYEETMERAEKVIKDEKIEIEGNSSNAEINTE